MGKAVAKKGGWRRAARITARILLGILILIILVFVLILTPPVQNFITKKATHFLENKIGTKVKIGRLFFTLSGSIAIDDIYLEDQSKDTLFSAGEVRVKMSLYKIIFKSEVDITSVRLDEGTIKLRRQLPDTTFNFQYIIDAFSSGSSEPKEEDESASTPINVKTVELNKMRFVYKDVMTGNDIETSLAHFDTRVDKIDLDKMHLIIPTANIRGLVGTIIQMKPLVAPIKIGMADKDTSGSSPFILELADVDIQESQIDYRDSVSKMNAFANIGSLRIRPQPIDVERGIYDLGQIDIKKTKALVRFDKRDVVEVKAEKVDSVHDVAKEEQGLRLLLSSLNLKDVSLQYDDENSPRLAKGMDYSHLKADFASFEASQFLLGGDSIRGTIKEAAFTEQSGFILEQLRTQFLYANNEAYLKDLYLKTPGTVLQKDIHLRYASPEALAADIARLGFDADLRGSKVMVKDLLVFVPALQQQPMFSNPNSILQLDGKVTGRVGDMEIEQLQISGLADARIDLRGRITGLPDAKKAKADLVINTISVTSDGLQSLLPKNTIPKTIALPSRMVLSGRINGGIERLTTDLALNTDKGNISIKGLLERINDAKRANYDIVVKTKALNLRSILKDTMYGPVTATITAKGRGYDIKTANAAVKAVVQSAVYNGYAYRDLDLNATIANQQLHADGRIVDPNIHLSFTGETGLDASTAVLKFRASIDSIKTKPLHFSSDDIVFRGNIDADFPRADPDSLEGKLFLTNALLVQNGQRIQLDTVQLIAGNDSTGKFMDLNSDVVQARIQGNYRLTMLPTIFSQVIEPYYSMNGGVATIKPTGPYDFKITASVIDKPLLHSLVTGLEKVDQLRLESTFSSETGMRANITARELSLNGNNVRGLNVTATTEDSVLRVKAVAAQMSSGSSIRMDSTIINASVAHNEIDFGVDIKDKEAKNKYFVGGNFVQAPNGDLTFSLKPDGLLLKYDAWRVSPDNKIVVASDGVYANNFTIDRGGQQLSINSTTQSGNSPMQVKFTDFRISTVTAMIMSDSTIVDGRITGQVDLKDLTTKPAFTGDLEVSNLSYHQDTIGNVHAKVDNTTTADSYTADIRLDGRGNEATIKGNYNAKSMAVDLDMNIVRLPMKTAEAFSNGAIRQTSGYVDGQMKIAGQVSKPAITGALNFNQAGLNVAMLNSYFTIDKEQLKFTDQGIVFDKFQVKDSTGNPMTIDGTIGTTDYTSFKFDLDLRANNFKALSSTKKDNKLFWGQLYFNANLKVKGTDKAPVVDGRLAINDKTKMTIVLPQPDPGVVDREGIIEFVDMDAPQDDSLLLRAYDSLNRSAFVGMDISVNVEVDKGADFTLVIDEGNGDFLNVKGEAQLTTGIDPSGKITMVGTYELEQGAYELSFNMIRKKFEIQKGSKIIWEGEPTTATVDIKAKYTANTAPLDLVKGQLDEDITAQERNTYLQKLPFDVSLSMQGQLLKPTITFDIILPENKSYSVSNDIITNVRTKLDQLRQSPGDMNKQVFSLLLLNRFVAENPFNASGSNNAASTLVKRSVSKLLTEQLNRLAEGLIQGVDINLGVEASDDYTTGERQDKTDLNVGLSKRLLNDRLTVTVGSNFALEGPQNSNQQSNNIAGNVAIDYALSSDGRYKLRAYRKNDYQGVIDGYVVETGVGFIITLDYNKLRQIFQSKKKQEQLRQERRKLRQEQEKAADAKTK